MILLRVIPILLCLTVHELAHGVAALALGDDTAKRLGRITLNPIKHIDPIGGLMLLFVGFGWAKAVPVNMDNFRNPKMGMALTALAGPMSNFLFALLIAIFQVPLFRLLHGGGLGNYVGELLFFTIQINVILGIFNLVPIPPLDGSKIVFSFLRDSHYELLMQYERFGFLLLFALIFWGGGLTGGPLLDIMSATFQWVFDVTRGLSRFLFL